MKTLPILGFGLLAMALAGAADAAPYNAYGSGVTGTTGSTTTTPAQPFRPYRPYQGQSTYGGDPTFTTPRRQPYQNSGPGGFKPYQNNFKPYGSQGTMKPRAGTFDQGF